MALEKFVLLSQLKRRRGWKYVHVPLFCNEEDLLFIFMYMYVDFLDLHYM